MAVCVPKTVREVIKDLTQAGFELSRQGKHTIYTHPISGVSISVPTSHRLLSYGVMRKVVKAIEDSQ